MNNLSEIQQRINAIRAERRDKDIEIRKQLRRAKVDIQRLKWLEALPECKTVSVSEAASLWRVNLNTAEARLKVLRDMGLVETRIYYRRK